MKTPSGRCFMVIAAVLSGSGASFCQELPSTIADNHSILIDGISFTVTAGTPKTAIAPQIRALNARELGPGALIFRSGEKLYIIASPLPLTTNNPAMEPTAFVTGDGAQPNRIRVDYGRVKNPDHQALFDLLKDRHSLEKIQEILKPLRLPMDLWIKTASCDGIVNAW